MAKAESRKRMKPHPSFEEYDSRWVSLYNTLNYGSSLSSRLLHHSHVLAEKRFASKQHFRRVLEVGAGTGAHLGHVRHSFDEYVITDLRNDMLERAKSQYAGRFTNRVSFKQENATGLSFEDDSFDRLIAVHVLEHLNDPHLVLAEWARVVCPGGVVTIVLPCDPGWLWRMGRYFGPRRKASKFGLDYDYWMAREHINSAYNLIQLIRFYFDRLSEAWFPVPVPSVDLNLFYIAHIEV